MVSVPIGTEEYVVKRLVGVVLDRGEKIAVELPRRPAGQASADRHRHRTPRSEDDPP